MDRKKSIPIFGHLIMQKIEIERKYLVKFENWDKLFELLNNLISIKRIEQVYLKAIKGDPAVRIRKTVEGFKDKKTYFEINQKKPAGKIVNKEKEKKISEEEFKRLLKHKDPSLQVVKKTRLVFKHQNQNFELDIFQDYLKGLLVLEIELKSKDQQPKLPEYVKIIKEISKEDQFNNYELSKKTVRGYKNGKLIKSAPIPMV